MAPITEAKRSSARMIWLTGFVLLLLPGCGSDQPYLIDKAILLAVLAGLKPEKKLVFSDAEPLAPGQDLKTDDEMAEDRHKAWFIFRRSELIGHRHSSFTATDLVPVVRAQFSTVETYLEAKVGPGGPLNGLFEPGGQSSATADQEFTSDSTHHLDLANVAIAMKGGTSALQEEIFRGMRWKAVRAIVWHAAGLHDELWSNGGDGATLNTTALNEILDRRLRSVERMRFQVNGEGGETTSAPGNGRGPWQDGSRVRVFEYPYFNKSLIDPGDINVIWSDFSSTVVQYNAMPAGLETRFDAEPTTPSANWLPDPTGPGTVDRYMRIPGSGSIVTALDTLFQSRLNVWERSWLFCDHSIAAMHLEALRFALQRRGQGSTFDTLVRPKGPFLAGILGGHVTYDSKGKPSVADSDTIWSDGVSTGAADTGVFDNLFVDYRDLQVGDHVILWNHHLYVFVTRGAWRLENSFVTDIDPVLDNWDEKHHPIDPAVFMKPDRKTVELAGFGETHDYPTFLRVLFQAFVGGYKAMQRRTRTQAGDFFVFTNSASKALVVRWAPYSTGFDVDDPWWVFLRRIAPGDRDSPWPTKQKMRDIIKHSVIDDSGRGSDYVSPPTSIQVPGEERFGLRDLTDGVFFPLFLPKVKGVQMTWDDYFKLRNDQGPVNTTLADFEVNTSMIPGLFVRGAEQPIETIRPRVRP